MSGHSKWSTIKRQKGAADIKRGQAFTKMGNAITIAVREGGGGDPASNFKLRLAMDQARVANMPKENIQRAIDRGLGKAGSGAQLETVSYEGYAPGKVALIVEAATDNRSRTSTQIKGLIERGGGTFASQGAVLWMFQEQGLVTVKKDSKSFDEIFEKAVEAGAEDVEESGEFVEVYTKSTELDKVKNSLLASGLAVVNAELFKKPTTTVAISDSETSRKILNLMEKLEELDDVQKVYANFDIPDEILKQSA